MDPKGGSSVIPIEELPRDSEEEPLRDPEEYFLLRLIQSTIQESDLERLYKKFQIPPIFELEVPLDTYQVWNPPLGHLALYREFFLAKLSLSLVPFFIEFFSAIGLPPCTLIPNTL